MGKLDVNMGLEELEKYLLYHMDNADDRESKINPSLTKEDIWNINMHAVMFGDTLRVTDIIVKNLAEEFGRYYE